MAPNEAVLDFTTQPPSSTRSGDESHLKYFASEPLSPQPRRAGKENYHVTHSFSHQGRHFKHPGPNKYRVLPDRDSSFSSSFGSIMSRPTGKAEDGSVMTNGTFMVMARPDGTRGCVKHPQLVLEGWTCPECEKEFNEGHNALQQRKANLDNRLQEIGQQQQQQQQQQTTTPQQQQQPSLTATGHSPMGPMSVQAQQGLYATPTMSATGGPPPMALGPYGTPGLAGNPYGVMASPLAALSNSLQAMSMNGPVSAGPTSSSASLETLALQINRMQQMQDWMLLQKEREVQMLRQELAEANQKLHTTQLEHALLQEKMTQQKIQHEQELKYLQLSAAAAANSNFQAAGLVNPPPKSSGHQEIEMKAAAAASAHASIMSSTPNKDAIGKNTMATGIATGTTTPTAVAGVRKPPPSVAKPENTANNLSASPAKAGNSHNFNSNVADMSSNNNMTAIPVKNSPPQKTAPKKNPPPAEAPKNATPAMKLPPGNAPNQSNNDIANNNKAPPPTISHIPKHPPASLLSSGKNDFGIPTDINVDDDAPPTVPLQEDITLGTLGKTQSWRTSVLERTTRNVSSDRFEPRYIAKNEGEGMETGDSFPPMLPNDQQSLTVASSTYGEDRQKVVNHSLLDPYGDKGIYTGLILKSTGMPHGSGRMIYEEDQRIYEGEWRHGRWHGFGRAKFANGDSYEGEYRFDQRHGNGKYSWADGRSYDGQFSEDRRHGKGLFVWPDGAIYEGQFANGQREGHGSYKFSDGGQYTGDWKDGRYNGFGTCSWEDGRCYRGEWRNGMAHGKGIETYADGTVRHDGQWVDDEPIR